MDEPKSIKEFWSDPVRERRRSAGRRESDYSVCVHHDDIRSKCGEEMKGLWKRLEILEERIVGKWTFGVIVTILLAAITLSSGASAIMFQSIKAEIKSINETVK